MTDPTGCVHPAVLKVSWYQVVLVKLYGQTYRNRCEGDSASQCLRPVYTTNPSMSALRVPETRGSVLTAALNWISVNGLPLPPRRLLQTSVHPPPSLVMSQ